MFNIEWSSIYPLIVERQTLWQRKWIVPDNMLSGFFIFWDENRSNMVSNGFSIAQEDTNWILYETKSDKSLFNINNNNNNNNTNAKLKSNILKLPEYNIKYPEGLREWQVKSVAKMVSIINEIGAAVDGSDLGVGKTYGAIGLARELNVPFVVVCPKAVIPQWQKVITKHFKLDHLNRGIINYELLIRGRTDSNIASYIVNRKTKRRNFVWKIPSKSLIIWDEAHKLKNFKTKASKTCMAACKDNYKQLFLSATMATSPLDLRTIGTCLKLFNTAQSYYDWAFQHGVYQGTWGLEFNNNKQILTKIHSYLFKERGIRITRNEIPNFPEAEIIINSYDIDENKVMEINKHYLQMQGELKRLNSLIKKEENELVIRLRYRQKIELLKIELFEELAKEGLEAGMSVLLFVNYTDTINILANKLNTDCIYDGYQKEKTKQLNLQRFQNNSSKIIILQSKSGNAGLNLGDEFGGHPRLAIISPDDSAVVIKQCCGRSWRENSKSKSIIKIPFVNNTVEEKVVDNMNLKISNIDSINDGDIKLF